MRQFEGVLRQAQDERKEVPAFDFAIVLGYSHKEARMCSVKLRVSASHCERPLSYGKVIQR